MEVHRLYDQNMDNVLIHIEQTLMCTTWQCTQYISFIYWDLVEKIFKVSLQLLLLNAFQVSFKLCSIVDDGKTVVSRAGRTRPGYTGHRFTSTMFTWLTTVSMERQKFEYQVFTSLSHIKPLLRRLERGEFYKVLDKVQLEFI